MVRFGVLTRRSYPEKPPRVEYVLTTFGLKIAAIVEQIEALQAELDSRSRVPDAAADRAPRQGQAARTGTAKQARAPDH